MYYLKLKVNPEDCSNRSKRASPIAIEGVKTPFMLGSLSNAKHTAVSPNILDVDPYPGSLSPITLPIAVEPSSSVT